MEAGTAVDGNPQVMNCRRAIWAEASCIATRSGDSFKYSKPLIWDKLPCFRDSAGFNKCEYNIFSAKVNGWLLRISLTWESLETSLAYGGVRACN
ncbi:hypothetical protein WICPIJ_002265 [Wickerhamomyces pijperi]|uniref:Uncharacterized protein n=1 Tax=Wickerhamomyces pijperi TaxID=599730 RepID=A0A9P8QA74_WICPI|nr:hypothetical protein WICPIJ_002265 [Wickerhamomyces pijperi]